jgi:hypothetical protein
MTKLFVRTRRVFPSAALAQKLRAVRCRTALNKGWGGEKKAKSGFVLLITILGSGTEPALNEP